MLKIKSFVFLLFTMYAGIGLVSAQKVVVKNGVEYIEETSVDNLNTINAPTKILNVTIKRLSNKQSQVSASIEDVIKTVAQKRTLRFRKKRMNKVNKCYKKEVSNCKSNKKRKVL